MMIYLQTIDTAEDRSKFERLYEQYKQLMFYTAFQILKRPQDAEDAVHLAFLSIAENISRISDLDCPKTRAYIVTIVERKAIDMLRAERRHPSVPLDESINGVSVEYSGDNALAKAILELPAASALSPLSSVHSPEVLSWIQHKRNRRDHAPFSCKHK